MNFHGWKLSTFCFILIRAYKSLCTSCCTEARSQSYPTFVCDSFYLINANSLSLPPYAPFSHFSFQAVSAHLQPPSSWSILFLFYGEERPPGLRGLGAGMGRGRVSPRPGVCRNRTLVSLLGLRRLLSDRQFQPPFYDAVFYRVLRDEGPVARAPPAPRINRRLTNSNRLCWCAPNKSQRLFALNSFPKKM